MKTLNFTIVTAPLWLSLLVGCNPGGSDVGKPTVENHSPVAIAAAPNTVTAKFRTTLNASDSHDEDDDALTYKWQQLAGPDVTENVGFLSGEEVSFTAPETVDTLLFNLVVNDGTDDSEAMPVAINVLENAAAAYFVDGDLGSDSEGVGTREAPFASITKALCSVTSAQQDIYVKNRAENASYVETQDSCFPSNARETETWLTIPTGTSLYGGYNEQWHRDIADSTLVDTAEPGFIFKQVNRPAWFSGFNVFAEDASQPGRDVSVISVLGGDATLTIADNQLMAGDVAAEATTNPGSSYGVRAGFLAQLKLERNMISAGAGGNALHYEVTEFKKIYAGGNGANASKSTGGSGGDGKGTSDYDGGRGGNNNNELQKNGEGRSNSNAGRNGSLGTAGNGVGSVQSVQDGDDINVAIRCGDGNEGARGYDGYGGNGGAGGADAWPNKGGGGGGGGGGGQGGAGGVAGVAGCASIGVLLTNTLDATLNGNTITSNNGGRAGSGGKGQSGTLGGNKGAGANGNCSLYCSGNGKDGTNGQTGGNGGRGGAGGGGPSFGVVIGSSMAPIISGNDIRSGNGGRGGPGRTDGNGGEGGHSYAVYDSNLNDGLVPVLSDNQLSFGNPGTGGTTLGSKGSPGSNGQATATNW